MAKIRCRRGRKEMAERPILFSGPMVRAILEGRKTQTRRTCKPVQPNSDGIWPAGRVPDCPYGAPGDLLWVRETWAHYQCVDHIRRADGRAFSEVSDGLAGYKADGFEGIEDFRKHVKLMSGSACESVEINGDRWRPSIHMPRWASRITLKVTDVRVERLQQISEADANAEGVVRHEWEYDNGEGPETDRAAFECLWSHINGADSWAANPWVWVVSFERQS